MKQKIYLIFSILVTLAVYRYVLVDLSYREVKQLLFRVDLRYLAAFFLLSITGSVLRTWRFAIVLASTGHKPSKFLLFLVVLVRNLCSDLLPARLGSLIFIFLANNRLAINFWVATAVFSVALLLDLLVMLPVAAVLILWLGLVEHSALLAASLLIAVTGLSFYFLLKLPDLLELVRSFISKWNSKMMRKLDRILSDLAAQFESVNRGKIYPQLLLISFAVRVCKYFSLLLFLLALVVPIGFKVEDLPIAGSLFGIVAAEVAASLPISGIAGFGIYEGTWAVVFERIGYSSELAQTTGVAHHLFTQLYGWLLGLVALLALFPGRRKGDTQNRR